MITKNILNNKKTLTNLIFIRNRIHPVPAKTELIHGKSEVGNPVTYDPFRTELEKGKSYAWCSCGASSKQPFCDGSHKKLSAETGKKFEPLRFTCEESRTVLFCMCKSSSNRPFCDSTHEQLKNKSNKLNLNI